MDGYSCNVILSIIVPVYNIESYLCECLDSLACSSRYGKIEIILIDDGSTDGSAKICDEYARKDPRIRVIHKPNGGLVSARKAGVEAAVGDYVTFVDGDDWVDIDWYTDQIETLERQQPDIIAFGCVEEYGTYTKPVVNKLADGLYVDEELENVKSKCIVDGTFFAWNILPHLCDKIIRRDILDSVIRNTDECITFGEDAVTTYPCIWKAKSLLVVNDTPYHYRQRSGSMSKIYDDLSSDQMNGLYNSLKIGSDGLYDDQVSLYMHFITLLRKYSIYDKYEMVLFPFEQIKSGASIIVYGAGGFGKSLYKYVKETGKCEVISWVDRDYKSYQDSGLDVSSVDNIIETKFDYIVIAILNEKIAGDISNELLEKGIAKDKILFITKEIMDKYRLGVEE